MIPFLSAVLWLATYRLLMRPLCYTVRERRWCLLVTLISWLLFMTRGVS